jgi:hypothetical protein
MGFTFELNSAFYQDRITEAEQVSDDKLIESSDNGQLVDKFGMMTGLTPRSDQTTNNYRTQTSCLWKSFNHAGTEKGVIDSLKCLIGDVTMIKQYTRDMVGNRIYTLPRFEYDNWWTAPNIITIDTDYPHYYMGYLTEAERVGMLTYAVGQSPTERLDPDGTPAYWTSTNVESLTIHSVNAIGNELLLTVPTAASIVPVVGESITKRLSSVSTDDNMGNQYVASVVVVTQCYIGGVLVVGAGCPAEVTNFTVDRITGVITWLGTALEPDPGIAYKVNYSFRLDEQMGIVVRQVKPAHRKVVILFDTVTAKLPLAVIA